MKKKILFTIACVFLFILGYSQGYKIKFHIDNYADSTASLAYYFSDKQYVVEKKVIDKKGEVIFSGEKALHPGLYLFFVGDFYFDFIVNGEQNFSVKLNPKSFPESIKFKKSVENQAFFNYQKHIKPQIAKLMKLQERIDKKEISADSTAIVQAEIEQMQKELDNYWKKVAEENKGSFLSHLLRATNGGFDEEFSNIEFSDSALLYSPVIYRSLQHLLARNINQNHSSDVFIRDIDSYMQKASANMEIYQFSLRFLIDFLHSYTKVGLNKVFAHLAYEYFQKDTFNLFDDKIVKTVVKLADTWTSADVGKIAPDLVVENIDGDTIKLSDMKSRYTLLLFWKTGCGHCEKAVRTLKQFYDQTDNLDINIFAVYVKSSKKDWEKFLDKEGVRNLWTNVWDSKDKNDFHSKYYVVSTPILYVLDKNRKVLSVWNGDSGVKELVEKLNAQRAKLQREK